MLTRKSRRASSSRRLSVLSSSSTTTFRLLANTVFTSNSRDSFRAVPRRVISTTCGRPSLRVSSMSRRTWSLVIFLRRTSPMAVALALDRTTTSFSSTIKPAVAITSISVDPASSTLTSDSARSPARRKYWSTANPTTIAVMATAQRTTITTSFNAISPD